ncbi:MAG: helix-turn-helix domain-containing protein [Achromobacter sp.]|uniref:helix-turn-helix domain-containing protein n=1 Tax=Achromobacter sp. TaxID=134375 RepID=UPI003D0722FD
MVTFGRRLRAARKSAKLTQAAAAKKAGMSQPTLSELENDTYPTSTFTTRLAHIYNVNARWLADGEGPMQSDTPTVESSTPAQPARLWPFSSRISPEAYEALDASTKEDIEDYVEMKLSKAAGTPRKSHARKAREAA